MITFARANVAAANAGSGGLSPALRLTHQMRRDTTVPNGRIGLGWHLLPRPGDPLIFHNGGTGGYRSFVGFRPSDGAAVIVLSASATWSVDALAVELVCDPRPTGRSEG